MRAVGVSMTGTIVALAISCASAFGQTPSGLEPGVHVDPGSPAAKEYALPLNQARQTGAQSSSRGSSAEAVLFGAGIKPPGSGGSPRSGPGAGNRAPGHGSASGQNAASGQRLASGASAGGAPGSQAPLPAAVLRAASTSDSPGGDGSILALLGGGVAILVLGAFGGTVLRHSRRATPPGMIDAP